MATAARAVARKTRKGRPGKSDPIQNIKIINSDDNDNVIMLRTQRIVRLFGFSSGRARVIADLAWGGAHG